MHVDGYVSIDQYNEEFIFPIGDQDKFRPMIISSADGGEFSGAYYYQNPDGLVETDDFESAFSSSEFLLDEGFDVGEKIYFLSDISEWEFWDLNGVQNTQVTLTWDEDSNINIITDELNELVIVGWSIENERWESLGNVSYEGNFNSGKITSVGFTPNNYEIITFGSVRKRSNNFYISPNNDEYNQTVVFDELEEYEQGSLKIFNRWGNIVFESADYQNDFDGTSNGRATILKDRKLPDGTYFYEFEFGNETFENLMQGWIYISR